MCVTLLFRIQKVRYVYQIKIYRNHPKGANLIFLVGVCFAYKTHYV